MSDKPAKAPEPLPQMDDVLRRMLAGKPAPKKQAKPEEKPKKA